MNDDIMNYESIIINDAFKKEIGFGMDSILLFLSKEGISLDSMEKMTTDIKNAITNEVDKKHIPYEYRFLLITVMLGKILETTVAFYKEYMKLSQFTLEQKDGQIDINYIRVENKDK
jgi:hypothetical protein